MVLAVRQVRPPRVGVQSGNLQSHVYSRLRRAASLSLPFVLVQPPYEMGKPGDKDDMNRYLFYFERYFNHGQSLKIADKQRLATMVCPRYRCTARPHHNCCSLLVCMRLPLQEKMKILVKEGLHFQRVEFLLRATELVLECRRVLKWTYVKGTSIESRSGLQHSPASALS